MFPKILRWGRNWGLMGVLLSVAFLIRVYRLDELLGFYFDQGRDALTIRDLIVNHKLFLIGPTTGIEGIFLGPLYYFTLLPWYWLGSGDPVFPAIYLSATTVLALIMTAKLADEIFGRRTAYIFIALGGFSYWLVVASRWLSNPTQLMLSSSIMIWGLWQIIKGNLKYWLVVSLGLGVSLQFEAASAFFFLPAILIFLTWQRKKAPKGYLLIFSLFLFILTLLPQALFDLRHDSLMIKSFYRFLISEQSFRHDLFAVLGSRLNYYWQALWLKIVASDVPVANFMLISVAGSLVLFRSRLKSDGIKLLLLWLLTPLIGLLFYQGNSGYVWDYYLTGIYLVFVLLVSVLTAWWTKYLFGKALFIVFMLLFIWLNLPLIRNYLVAGTDGPVNVVLGNEKQAVNWVLQRAKQEGEPYNTDVYVPPVIPHAYDYLFKWLGTKPSHLLLPSTALTPKLYTIYEVDVPHPERLAAWLTRQKKIGRVDQVATFGGITVEQRTRIK